MGIVAGEARPVKYFCQNRVGGRTAIYIYLQNQSFRTSDETAHHHTASKKREGEECPTSVVETLRHSYDMFGMMFNDITWPRVPQAAER
eukprot:scaffold1416_cov90-Cylindrotheca_fusiformis.AAC.6